ncbi:MAG: alpha/beta hydrolase [Clostridia bacterium]|nr:alpha/beta hydrolase [Clostridia bacterium]
MQVTNDLSYGMGGLAQKLDVYLPEGASRAVFVYFHGGGLERGDKSGAKVFAPDLTDHGVAVISANYRMYPEAQYPQFIEDAAQAVAWAHRYARESLGCDQLYVGGSSAGGYLSMMLCFDGRYLADVGLDNSAIRGYFHDAGQPTAHFAVLKHRGVDPRRVIVDETSPLYYVGLEKEYPPMRFIVSDNDMKNRYEQTELMLSTLTHFEYQGFDRVVMHGKHCAYVGRLDENGESVMGRMILDFLERVQA